MERSTKVDDLIMYEYVTCTVPVWQLSNVSVF